MNREFFQPVTLNEALKYRREYEGSALVAGGTDLAVAIHKDKGPEGNIIDLSRIKELKEIRLQGDEIKIGSMATFTAIEESETLNEKAKIICQGAKAVGSPQIRNRGTIGGNVCNASPAADMVSPLVCLEARVELQSMDNEGAIHMRVMALEDFITCSNKTLLKEDEILTSIIFKVPSYDIKMGFKKIGRRNALAIARVNGACLLKIDDSVVTKINLAIGAVTTKPERFSVVEDYLRGKELNNEVLREAGALAAEYVLKQTGRRSSSTYKLPVIAKFTASLIENVLEEE